MPPFFLFLFSVTNSYLSHIQIANNKEMRMFYSTAEYIRIVQLLNHYYGIKEGEVKSIIDASEDGSFELNETNGLRAAYETLGTSINDIELLKTLQLLVYCQDKHPNIIGTPYSGNRLDLLRLVILLATTKEGDMLIIKNKTRSFQLDNNHNWVIKQCVQPFLQEKGLGALTSEEAQREIDNQSSRRRGRRYKDPRMPIVLWGTFRLLSDLHGFHTPMPNILCNFLVLFLQFMMILPQNTDIDALWIRAQLRYIRGKQEE